jgi:hypothetical protein
MKKLIFILIVGISTTSFSQMAISNDFVVTTPTRDTMYVVDCPQGRTIYKTWLEDPEFEGYSPKVFLVPSLEPYRCCAVKKCKRKKRS